ncbi:MAG: 3'-5' exoribonuclease [Bacteroidota bacterium]
MQPIFLDTEFSGLQQHAQLLSLALVPQSGPWFYAVFSDVDLKALSDWHQEHVVPHLRLSEVQLQALPPGEYILGRKSEILPRLRAYLAAFDQVVIWADVPAYDWVLFCELFGGAFGLPKNIHYIVRDLATLLEAKGYDIDTDRFDLAYNNQGADAGARVSSADGRVQDLTPSLAPVETNEGLLQHNALGDALACRKCHYVISQQE